MNFLARKTAEYEAKLVEAGRKKKADWQEIKTRMPDIANVLELTAKFFGKSTLLGFKVNNEI